VDENTMVDLKPGESVTSCMTLLRGGEGALFDNTGVFKICVSLRWALPSGDDAGPLPDAVVEAKTTVLVTGPENPEHAKAAHNILTTPDAHTVLVLGGDYLDEGVDVIKKAAADAVLAPHWKAVEIKRLANEGKKDDARKLLDTRSGEMVMSSAEEKKISKLLGMKKEKKNGWVKVSPK
jgi:hypothetical protein